MVRFITFDGIIACFFLLIVAGTAPAQTSPDTLEFTMDTLRVEAVRSRVSPADAPLALSIRNRSEQAIRSQAGSSLSSLTAGLPGIWVNNRHNSALGERITIRGIGWRAAFGVRGIQMVLDGIPLTVADGQSVTNIVDPAMIQRIELVRGPAASYWGNSSGGVLYLSTDPDMAPRTHYRLRTYAGSFQHRKADFKFDQSFGDHEISGYTSYEYEEGFRTYSSSKLLRSGLRGSQRLNESSRLRYMGAFLWMPQAQHPSGLTAEQVEENPRQANTAFVNTGAGKEVTQGQIGLSYERTTGAGLLTLTSYGTYRDLANPLPFGIITVDRRAGGIRATLEKQLGRWDINVGGELKYQHDDREEFENDNGQRGAITVNQVEKVSNQALFVSTNFEVGSFTLLGSLRYDRITFAADSASDSQTGERTFQSLSPGMGVSYRIGKTTFFSNVSTSFEAPTTTELVNRPDGGNGFNPNLKPEHTLGFEVGNRGIILQGRLEYDITFYQLWIQDLLFPYQLQANGPTFYRNQGETRHKGIEVSAILTPHPDLSLQSTYTLTDAQFVKAQTIDNQSLAGNDVPGVANHRLATALNWSPDPFWFELVGQYVSSYPVNNLNTAENQGYFLLDAKLSYEKQWETAGVMLTPFININNLLDNHYNGSVVVNAFGGRYYEPAPGRNWEAGLSLQF